MSKVKKKDVKKYADMWTKVEGTSARVKKKADPLKPGKAQARIEVMFWDKTGEDKDCIKTELTCLTGPNKARKMFRTFYIEDRDGDDEKTIENMNEFKAELGKIGVSALKTPDEAMDSLEEVVIEVSIWRNAKKPEKYPIIFFQKFIKGPEDDDDDKEVNEDPDIEEAKEVEEATEPESNKATETKKKKKAPAEVVKDDDDDDDIDY